MLVDLLLSGNVPAIFSHLHRRPRNYGNTNTCVYVCALPRARPHTCGWTEQPATGCSASSLLSVLSPHQSAHSGPLRQHLPGWTLLAEGANPTEGTDGAGSLGRPGRSQEESDLIVRERVQAVCAERACASERHVRAVHTCAC